MSFASILMIVLVVASLGDGASIETPAPKTDKRAQLTRTYSQNSVLHAGTGLTFYWNMVPATNPTSIQIGLSASVGGYISVGFSAVGTMANLDCMMCYTDTAGTGSMADYFVNGHNTPTQDAKQDYTKVSVKRSGSTLYCEFDRLISNANDPTRDFLLSTSATRATNIVWGVHTTRVPASLASWALHDLFGAKQVILCPQCVAVAPPPPPPTQPGAPKASPAPTIVPGGANQTLDGTVAPGEYPSTVTLEGGNFVLSWKVDKAAGTIQFAMTANGMGYAALGIGKTMTNSDYVIGYFVTNPAGGADILVVDDFWSTGQTTPTVDTDIQGQRNILAYGGAINNGKITIEFLRPLVASESNDQAFEIGKAVDVNYAWTELPSDFLLNHGPKNRGTTQIFISEDGSQTLPPPDRKPALRLAHLIFMYLAFAVFAPISAIVARYARGFKNELWFKLHRILVFVEFTCSLLGLFVILGGIKEDGGHFQTANHAQIGIAVLAMNLVMILMGIYRIKTPEPEDTDTTLWRVWYQFHRWVGRIMIILATAAIFTGMYEYGADQFFYGWHAGLVATFVSFVFFAEFRTWKHMGKKVEAV